MKTNGPLLEIKNLFDSKIKKIQSFTKLQKNSTDPAVILPALARKILKFDKNSSN